MANGKWVIGGRVKGMDFALWVMQGTARTRRQACRRVPARTLSLLQLLRFIVFVAETRETVGGRACIGLAPCALAGLLWRAV